MSQRAAHIARARRIGGLAALTCALSVCLLVPPAHAVTSYALSGTVNALPGTTPLADVTVDVHDASTDALAATATTDADGRYATTVPAGTYKLHATPPAGSPFRDATTQATTVSADTTVDIGLVRPGVNAVQGRVVDGAGAPLAGVSLSLSNGESFAAAVTDADGRYAMVLPDGSYSLGVSVYDNTGAHGLPDVGHVAGSLTIAGDRDDELRLRANDVAVHVVSSDGAPVSGATLATNTFVEGTTSLFGQTMHVLSFDGARSDEEGLAHIYVFDLVASPVFPATISVSPPAGSGLAGVNYRLPPVSGGDLAVTVRLPVARAVRGRVVDRAGAPLAGVSLSLSNGESFAAAVTDADGRYAMVLPDGSYSLGVSVYDNTGAHGLPDVGHVAGSLTIAGDRDDELRLRANDVAVHVVSSDGAPVSGATLATNTFVEGTTSLFGQTMHVLSFDGARSDEEGLAHIYVFDLVASPVFPATISVSPPAGSGLAGVNYRLPPVSGGDLAVTVRLPVARAVRGRVVDRAGAPLAGVSLSLSNGESFAAAVTDADGRYAMVLPDGSYTLGVSVYDNTGAHGLPDVGHVAGSLTIAGDRDDELRLRANDVAVHVVSSDGAPVSGATLATNTFVEGTTSLFGQTMHVLSFDGARSDEEGLAHIYVFDLVASPVFPATISVSPPTASGLPGAYLMLPVIHGDTAITLSYDGGIPSAVAVAPNAYAFGLVVTGSTVSADVSISNVLGRDVTPSSVALTGADAAEFRIASDGCTSHTMRELEGCTVTVEFKPSSYGPKSATLVIVDDGPGSPRRVALSGAGKDVIAPTIDIRSPTDGDKVELGDSLLAQFSCADEAVGSGLESCVGDVADGHALDTSRPGTYTFSVTARDRAGNERTRTVSYAVIGGPGPTAPTLSGTVPMSPANNNAPRVVGSAPSGTTVQLYALAGCDGSIVASGTAAQLASPGIGVSVADNSTTSFSATATDAAGRVSDCSQKVQYVEDSIGPGVAVTKHSLPVFATVGQPARVTVEFVTSEDAVAGCRIRRQTETPPPAYVEPCRSGDTLEVAASPVVATRTYLIEVLARDAASNTGFGSTTVLIQWQPAKSARAQITALAPGTVFVTDSARLVVPRARVTCPSDPPRCEVTTTARLLGRRARSRGADASVIARLATPAKVPAGRRIGVGSYRLAPGKTGKARFTLTKQAMRELRRGLRLTATVKIAVKHGNRTTTKTVRLKIAKKRRLKR